MDWFTNLILIIFACIVVGGITWAAWPRKADREKKDTLSLQKWMKAQNNINNDLFDHIEAINKRLKEQEGKHGE